MSAASNDIQYLRCLKCMNIIKCSRYDTSCLVRHVQEEHPEIIDNANEKIKNLHKLAAEHGISQERLSEISKMTGMSEKQMADEADRYLAKHRDRFPEAQQQQQQPDQAGSQAQAGNWEQPRVIDSRDINRRQYYRTSIQRWMPTEGYIYCPSCGCSRRPLLKTSSEFYCTTGCPAACVLNCWPFCFLPCFNSADNREYLHCSNCKTFLGIYDREHNCVRPNRDFIPLN